MTYYVVSYVPDNVYQESDHNKYTYLTRSQVPATKEIPLTFTFGASTIPYTLSERHGIRLLVMGADLSNLIDVYVNKVMIGTGSDGSLISMQLYGLNEIWWSPPNSDTKYFPLLNTTYHAVHHLLVFAHSLDDIPTRLD